jgi:alanyl-tRNA synthetase
MIGAFLCVSCTQSILRHDTEKNRSFGDYFKEGAIDMAWECLTQEFGLDPDRLYATYFSGDDGSPEDTEARDFWLKYLPPSRVLPFDAKDNFWEMGATGPCGPCTVSVVVG